MANNEFSKRVLKHWGELILALVLIVFGTSFYFQPGYKINPEHLSLLRDPKYPSTPQYPTIFTSKGVMETQIAKVIYQRPSHYGGIVVFDYDDYVRCYMLDGANESCWNFDAQRPSDYIRKIKLLLDYFQTKQNIKDILIIGVGAGTLLKDLEGKDYVVDGVEVNPKMLEIAKNYFQLPQNLDFNIIIDDGRHFLNTTDKKYDAIVLDICYVDETNVHLWTKEFYALAISHLKDPQKGIIIASQGIVNDNPLSDKLAEMIANAMAESFSHLYTVIPSDDTSGEFEMAVYLATNHKVDVKVVSRPSLNLADWNFNSNYPPTTDQRLGQIIKLSLPASEKIREQVINNFGVALLLPI